MDVALSNINISTSYSNLDISPEPPLYSFDALLFSTYFSLVFCLYPACFALYPTLERLHQARALQYSIGVRPLPLWLAYLSFDLLHEVLISVISTVLLSFGSQVWYQLPYIFIILLLYGISSTLLSYVISMFARSQLAAWAFCASGQVVMCPAYFGAYLGIQTSVSIGNLESTLNQIQYGLALFSPSANNLRSIFVSLNQFLLLCGSEANPGSIELYGGPILYLCIQILVLFCMLLCGISPITLIRQKKFQQDEEDFCASTFDEVSDEIASVKDTTSGLRVLYLTKSFRRDTKAVDDVTFGIKPGEIFALLGPNGAGKSTAIFLIRGDITPSSTLSSIQIDTTSTLSRPSHTRSQLGVCPQLTATDALTVTQTLRFYARICGIANPTHNVSEVVRSFGLTPYADRLTARLSGGTQRKLSLAIALIGNPATVLLDEPSSGLDAAAKRAMWRTLSSVSAGRSILLTTHSMEEADALADRAAIMSSRVLALGIGQALRTRWGGWWHVQVVMGSAPHTSREEVARVREWVVREVGGGARVEEEGYGGQVRFAVPAAAAEGGGGIGKLFRLLEANKDGLGVQYYSIGQTTLDEVFVRIVRENGGAEEENRKGS